MCYELRMRHNETEHITYGLVFQYGTLIQWPVGSACDFFSWDKHENHIVCCRHWLYGDKHIRSAANDDFSYRRERGWFPRRCAIKLTTEEAGGDSNKEKDE